MTDAGRALLPQAKAILEQARALQGHADAISAGEEGRLCLAVEESLVGPELESLLCRFEQQFPRLELELLNPAGLDIVSLVAEGRVDLGLLIAVFKPPKGYRIRPLGEMVMTAVVGGEHPLAAVNQLDFDDLQRHRQLILTARSEEMGSEQFSAQIWKVESQYALLELIKRGLGWAWAPEHMVSNDIGAGHLQRLTFGIDFERHHLPVDMLISNQYKEGKAGQWLYKELAKMTFLKTPS